MIVAARGAVCDLDRSRVPDLVALFARPPWMRDALCREPKYASLPWIPLDEKTRLDSRCREVCERCAVAVECLRFALERPDVVGCWAATTPRDRRRIGAPAIGPAIGRRVAS